MQTATRLGNDWDPFGKHN